MALRIGLFTECYRPIQNGIVSSVDALARAVRDRGHEAIIITPHMPHYRDDDRAQVLRIASLPLPTPTAYRLTVPYVPAALGDLSIVHAHSPFVTGVLAAAHARRGRLPLVFTYHTQLEAYAHYVPFEAHATRAAATFLTRAFSNAADAVVVPTAAMERRLRSLGVRSHISVVPSGIDVAAFAGGHRRTDLRKRFGVDETRRLVLVVGRLGREKNVEHVLAAFASLGDPQANLVIIGDGAHRATLERHAVRLGIAARTTFAREFARATLPDAYASADVLAFASRSETQGLVLAEALAAGTPIVALDTPQTRDVLAGAGTLVASEDPAAFAAALRSTLAGERSCGKGSAWRFDGAALGDRVMELYEALLEQPAPLTSNICSR